MVDQIRPKCRATVSTGVRCPNEVPLSEDFCKEHRPPPGPPLYFRSMADLWQLVEPAMRSLDRGPSGLLGVRMQATIVFADMCGFSKLGAEYSEAPHVAAFLGHHYLNLLESWGRAASRTLGVFLDKFVGDQIMLVIPGGRVRTTKIALDIACRWMTIGLYPTRVGIHWGDVWFGDVGIRLGGNRPTPFVSHTVMGQTVNIAARLCGQASEGEVLMYGIKNPRDPILHVPISSGWEIDWKVGEMKNILPGEAVLGRLRDHPKIDVPIDVRGMLESVKSDVPEVVAIDFDRLEAGQARERSS